MADSRSATVLECVGDREFEFTDCPSRLLEELKCPICLQLLTDPISTSCCQHLFCDACIRRVTSCPTCRSKDFTLSADVGSARMIGSLRVKCPNSKTGCNWKGELGDAEKHLVDKCPLSKYSVSNCGLSHRQSRKRPHPSSETANSLGGHSRKRPLFCCHFCGQTGVRRNATTDHYTTCNMFPVYCPSGCELFVPRKFVERHLSTCPLEHIACRYAMFGCSAIFRREDEDHEYDLHLSKETHNSTLGCKIPLCISTSSFVGNGHLPSLYTSFRQDMASFPLLFRPWLVNKTTCYVRPPFVFTVERFEAWKAKGDNCPFESSAFFSHFGGYKFCLQIYCNGYGNGKGTHISILVHLVEGDNDDNLKFPFQGTVAVSLLNQKDDSDHHSDYGLVPRSGFPCDPESLTSTDREETPPRNWDEDFRFISHEDLIADNPQDGTVYLMDDTLFLRVDRIDLDPEP